VCGICDQKIFEKLFLTTSSPYKNMIKHLYALDYIRAFAAISVCLYHFSSKIDYLPATDMVRGVFSYGHFGVEIFFIVSGLVIPYSMEKGQYTISKIFIFFKKRLIRIEPPYLVCILLALFLNYATTKSPVYNGNPFTLDALQLLYHLGYLNVFMDKEWLNPVFWTLAIEFQYYWVIALIFPLINQKQSWIWILILLIFNALSLISDRSLVFNFSIFFTTGILLYRFLVGKMSRHEALIASLAVILVLFFRYSYKEMIVVAATALVVLLPLRPSITGTFLGNISYSLYLLHFIIGQRLINLSFRFIESESLRQLMVFVALAVSIAAAYIYYIYVEKPFKLRSQRSQYHNEGARDQNAEISPVESVVV
jgi:peptidoglycan/LPS O-acetylase OafA/YrhL